MTPNEYISQNKKKYIDIIPLNEENDSILSDYADISIKCRSYELDQRPALDEILKKLENLSEKTTIEFITNCIDIKDQKTAQLITNYSERLDSSNNITECIEMNE
ncbi:32281_t:CDS:1, partial [Racocetra persica]